MSKKQKNGFKCVICGKWCYGWGDHQQYGNNPYPLADDGECCDECNKMVVTERIIRYREGK